VCLYFLKEFGLEIIQKPFDRLVAHTEMLRGFLFKINENEKSNCKY